MQDLLPCRCPVHPAAWVRKYRDEPKSSGSLTRRDTWFSAATHPTQASLASQPHKAPPHTEDSRGSHADSEEAAFLPYPIGKKKKNPQEWPQRLLQISCQKNICLTLELCAWEIKGNLFLLCNQTLEKYPLYFPSSLENYLDTLCPALSYPFY